MSHSGCVKWCFTVFSLPCLCWHLIPIGEFLLKLICNLHLDLIILFFFILVSLRSLRFFCSLSHLFEFERASRWHAKKPSTSGFLIHQNVAVIVFTHSHLLAPFLLLFFLLYGSNWHIIMNLSARIKRKMRKLASISKIATTKPI